MRIIKQLEQLELESLLNQQVTGLIIKNFYPIDLCERLNQKISHSDRREKYTHETIINNEVKQEYFGVDRIGFPFNLTYGKTASSSLRDNYYKGVKDAFSDLRMLSEGFINPIDLLRLQLDENFTEGAGIANFEGKKMRAGVIRLMQAEHSHLSDEQPHYDALPLEIAKLDSQLAANIYLKTPKGLGGELELWDVTPLEPMTVVPDNWRESLPTSIKIKPEQGDLVIFNCRLPHAISSFSIGERITAQVFIGFQKGKGLMLWN